MVSYPENNKVEICLDLFLLRYHIYLFYFPNPSNFYDRVLGVYNYTNMYYILPWHIQPWKGSWLLATKRCNT